MADGKINTIPLVDMRDKAKDPVAFAKAFGAALKDFGFVRLIGHGISDAVINEADEAGRSFWALPTAVKDKYASGLYGPDTGNGVCYVRNGEYALSSTKVDIKEELGINGASKAPHSAIEMLNAITEVPDLGVKTMRLYEKYEEIAKSLMGSIAVYSGESEQYFDDWFKERTAYMRQLNYPEKGNAEGHLDFSMLTLLHVSDDGLKVRSRKGQEFAIGPAKGELIINGGMQLDLITNLDIRSSWHWVEADRPRTSLPFFLHPMEHIVLQPLPKFRANPPANVPSYFPQRDENGHYAITTGEFNAMRRKEIYDKQQNKAKARQSLQDQLAISQ